MSSNTATPVISTVDSYADCGMYCTLNVAKSGTNQVPYIGYYSNKLAKEAYRVDFTEGNNDGAPSDTELYTGYWNISYVPTSTSISADTVNVAVYRDSLGDLQTIPTGTDVLDIENSNGKSTPGNSSIVYGNDSSNPIMAYITSSGSLEMGQQK